MQIYIHWTAVEDVYLAEKMTQISYGAWCRDAIHPPLDELKEKPVHLPGAMN